jgi:hypothetical protein
MLMQVSFIHKLLTASGARIANPSVATPASVVTLTVIGPSNGKSQEAPLPALARRHTKDRQPAIRPRTWD